jgi:hypothetical protein
MPNRLTDRDGKALPNVGPNKCRLKEILFSNNDPTTLARIPPDLGVRRLTKPGLHDVHTIAPKRSKRTATTLREAGCQ